MLGLDEKGEYIERYVTQDQFSNELQKATAQVGESTFAALQASPADQSAMLRSVVVGLGFNLKAALGPVASITVNPRVRFAFSNSQKPIVP